MLCTCLDNGIQTTVDVMYLSRQWYTEDVMYLSRQWYPDSTEEEDNIPRLERVV